MKLPSKGASDLVARETTALSRVRAVRFYHTDLLKSNILAPTYQRGGR
jgi:hypothetical protein